MKKKKRVRSRFEWTEKEGLRMLLAVDLNIYQKTMKRVGKKEREN